MDLVNPKPEFHFGTGSLYQERGQELSLPLPQEPAEALQVELRAVTSMALGEYKYTEEVPIGEDEGKDHLS